MIPEIADWCFLQMQENEGELQRTAAANLESRRTAEKLKDLLKTQRYQLAADPNERTILAATEAHSGMRVPLLLGNACLGVLTLFVANRTYTGLDLVFALELGHRAAVAIHNARQYRSAVEAAVKRPLVSVD
jgi:GAF domain-containing protein